MGHVESFGDSDNELAEKALRAVGELIADVQPGSMVQTFVLMVVAVDAEDRWISAFTAPGQKAWETLGLLDYATAMERSGMAFLGSTDDTDEDDD